MMQRSLTYVGDPTASIEPDGLRLLTDPTFHLPREEGGSRVSPGISAEVKRGFDSDHFPFTQPSPFRQCRGFPARSVH